MREYIVEYRMYLSDQVKNVKVIAKNKEDAYDHATYDLIPEKEGSIPYAAWVRSMICKNGDEKFFNTHEGMPY